MLIFLPQIHVYLLFQYCLPWYNVLHSFQKYTRLNVYCKDNIRLDEYIFSN